MTSLNSKPNILRFIELYRSYPALWKVKCKDYFDKRKKEIAYDKMIEFCRKFDLKADRQFVVYKIKYLRSLYRKEIKKMEMSQLDPGAEEIYEPRLWFFHYLTFLNTEQDTDTDEHPAPGPSLSLPMENEELEEIEEESNDDTGGIRDTDSAIMGKKIKLEYLDDESTDSNISRAEFEDDFSKNQTEAHNHLGAHNPEVAATAANENSQNTHDLQQQQRQQQLQQRTSKSKPTQNQKRKRLNNNNTETENDDEASWHDPMNVSTTSPRHDRTSINTIASDTITTSPFPDSNTIFGSNVAAKLGQMTREQRIFTERLINEALFYGELGHLNISSRVVIDGDK